MSQIKSKRKTSSAQFLETALQIQITTLRRVAKFPKRFTYLLSVHLTDAAARGFEQVKKANSIYPKNQHEAQIRRDCLIKAYAEYQHLISQVLALAAADKLDHFIKEQLRIKGYVRYMDDGWLLHESKEFLQECLERIKAKCKEDGLILNEKKTHIVKLSRGFTFLKVKYFVTDSGKVIRKISRESVTRERRKLKKLKARLDCNLIRMEDIQQSYNSWDGHASRFDSYNTRRSMRNTFNILFLRSNKNEVLQDQTREFNNRCA